MNKILNDIMILLDVNNIKNTSSHELADMLWLGAIIDNNGVVNEKKKEKKLIAEQEDSTDKEESSDIDSNSGGDSDSDSEDIEENNSLEEGNGADDKQEPSTTHKPLHLDNGGQESSSPSLSKGEYRKIPTPRHYTQYNQFATVLKILRQQSYSLTDNVLDEDATVEYIANTQIWNVVTKPKQELKFTLNIIIEKSESMMVWEEMTKDFVSAVSGFIFFKNLKVYYLEESEKEFQLYSDKKCQSKVSVNVFHSLEQRNITMLMSDCISQPWSDRRGYKFLQNITQLTPFMILNMLPQRIWKRTILDDTWRIKFTHKEGWLNQNLVSDIDEDACKVKEHIKVPMTTFDTISLKHWSNLVAGKKENWLYGSLFEAKWFDHPPQAIEESQEEENAVELVRDFEIFASPMAQKLAIYFTSNIPLSLGLMKIVQKICLPESNHTHLAEFFLSGLLKKTSTKTKSSILYEFIDGVQETLSDKIYEHKRDDIFEKSIPFVAKDFDSNIDIEILIENPNLVEGIELSDKDRFFVKNIVKMFDNMGEKYRNIFERLQQLLEEYIELEDMVEVEPIIETELEDNILFIKISQFHLNLNMSDENKNIGITLWESLSLDADIFKPTNDVLSIVIESDIPKVLQLPWELLYHPTYGFLAQNANFTMSRRIPNLSNTYSPLEKRPLRILFFSTLPDDIGEEGRLAVEHEQEVVLETIMPYVREGFIEIKVPNDGRFESLKSLIVSEKPDMVFLSGHGISSKGKGSFLFEDRRGLGVLIDDEELSSAFIGSSVKSVFISSSQGISLAFSGIANVIGMSQSFYEKSGITFVREFIRQVSIKSSIAYAVQKGREEVAKLDIPFNQHWHLPLLLSQDIKRGLVDWDFEPTPPSHEKLNQKLNQILYPNNYIGRRKEFRTFYNYLYSNKLKKLLLYGEGGMGKTAMVAKFGLELREEGYRVFDYSLRHGGDFDDFLFDIELELSEANTKKFTLIKERCHDENCVAKRLAKLLLSETPKIAFIFDNLESIQDPTTKEITDSKLKSWIEALSEIDGVVVLLTSRWLLPNCQHTIALNRPLKSDFLYFLSSQNINFKRKDKLDKIYQTFGGNYRAVEFFLNAIEQMSSQDEDDFLENILKSTDKMKIDIVIEKTLSYLSKNERKLLDDLTVYNIAVPKEGVRSIALSLPKDTVEGLASFSLVEKNYNFFYEVNEYQISSLVFEFIKDEIELSDEVKNQSADYLLWLFLGERTTVEWGIIAYDALKKVNREKSLEKWLFEDKEHQILKAELLNKIAVKNHNIANYQKALEYWEKSLKIYIELNNKSGEGATLNNISQVYYARGDLHKAIEYLEKSLKIQIEIGDKLGEGITLNNISQIYDARGDLPKALEYLEKSLAIRVAIGDKSGEGATLNNISQIYQARGDLSKALEYLEQSLRIRISMGDKLSEGTTLNNIATVYHARGDLSKALNYLERSLKIQVSIDDKAGEGITLNNISQIYNSKGNLYKAIEYLEKSLRIQVFIGDKLGEGTILSSISTIYYTKKDFSRALEYSEKSLEVRKEIDDKSGICATIFNIGHIYLENNDLEKALSSWLEVHEIAREIEDKEALEKLNILAKNLEFENFEELREKILGGSLLKPKNNRKITTQCYHCNHEFIINIKPMLNNILFVDCPFCNTKLKVELEEDMYNHFNKSFELYK